MRLSSKVVVLILNFLITIPVIARDPFIAITIEPSGTSERGASEKLEEILGLTITLALERAGWTPVLGSPGSPAEEAKEFRLSVKYTLREGKVLLSFRLEDLRGRVPEEILILDQDLDPQFDATVSRTVEALAWSAEEALSAIHVPVSHDEASPEQPIPGTPEATITVDAEIARKPQRPSRGPIGLRLGGSALIPVGDAGEYLQYVPRGEISFLFPPGVGGRGRLVLSLSGTALTLDWGNGPSGEAAVLQVGVGAACTFIQKNPLGLELEVKAGPALIGSRGVEIPAFYKVLPFIQAGVSAGYRPFSRWELGLGAAGLVFMDYGENFFPLRSIWVLIPSITVTRELM